jgi:hypothetical protein
VTEYPFHLKPTQTEGALVETGNDGVWRLQIPAGPGGKYRLAQLDDYDRLPRRRFPNQPPFRLKLRARASSREIPGTWGFGLWNDPFGMSIFTGVEKIRLPELPNAAWFFFCSPPNYLSLREDLPAQGNLAGVFRSPRLPAALLALGAPALPLLLVPPAYRLLRRLGSGVARQDSAQVTVDPTGWHEYEISWQENGTRLTVDGQAVLVSPLAPHPPLGLVIWVDNQYASVPPRGRPSFGSLPNPEPAWMDVADLVIE